MPCQKEKNMEKESKKDKKLLILTLFVILFCIMAIISFIAALMGHQAAWAPALSSIFAAISIINVIHIKKRQLHQEGE